MSDNRLEFTLAGQRLLADIEAPAGIEVSSETIREDCLPFERIAIRLRAPLPSGRVTILFRPPPAP